MLVPAGVAASDARAWPPWVPAADRLSPPVAAAVELLVSAPTFVRTVRGPTARVPPALYLAFVDAPEVTAAVARHLGLARYSVEPMGDGRYEASDGDGAQGTYVVLTREERQRVVLSRGSHESPFLGTITGSALTVLEFRPDPDGVEQSLTAHVRIDNRVAATLARTLLRVFGHLADRKLAEGFTVTARVAEWAVAHPEDFCGLMAQGPVDRRGGFPALLACAPVTAAGR